MKIWIAYLIMYFFPLLAGYYFTRETGFLLFALGSVFAFMQVAFISQVRKES